MYRANGSSDDTSKMPVSVKETRVMSCSYSFADYKNVYSTLMLRVTHTDYRATHFSWRLIGCKGGILQNKIRYPSG